MSRKFSAFIKDVSEALPGFHGHTLVSTGQAQLNRRSAALQKHNDTRCRDDDTYTPQPISKNGNISGSLDVDDCYDMLTGRIQALEGFVENIRTEADFRQSIATAGKSSAADTQESECAMQADQPTFSALSDASESSTRTLTPASVS